MVEHKLCPQTVPDYFLGIFIGTFLRWMVLEKCQRFWRSVTTLHIP